MAEFTEGLKILHAKRAVDDPKWFKRNYEKAVEDLETHSAGGELYYFDPVNENASLTGGLIQNFDGGTTTIEQAEIEAFRLLALIDLARTMST